MDGSDSSGQASIDYLAILAVVAVIFGTVIAAAGAPWLAPRIAFGIRHGICVVSGALCTPREAREAGLAPCPITRRSDAERLGGVALIRLERGDALVVERRSDGSASVSFVNSGAAGVSVGIGATLPGVSGSVSAGAGARFASGRTFDFGTWRQAQRFLVRFAGEETLTGEGRRVLRSLCWHCPEWLEGRGRTLPKPEATYLEGGSFRDFVAELGVGVPVASGRRARNALGLDIRGERAVILGRRTSGSRVTWYLRLQADVVSTLGAVLGSMQSGRQSEGVLELTTQRGRPVEARVRASAAVTNAAEIAGLRVDAATIAQRLREAAGAPRSEYDTTDGLAVEAAVSLDLLDPANLRAIDGLLHPGSSPLGWLERLRAAGRRFDVAGAVDLAVMRVAADRSGHRLEGGGLVRFGGGYGRVEETRDLVAAWSLPPGGQGRRREDCEVAAQTAA